MACNNITVTESDSILEVTSDKGVINLVNTDSIDLEVESQVTLVELKEDFSDVIQVTNVNSLGVGGFYETFTPTTGQTVFTLANIPTGSQILLSQVYVNGQKISMPACYTISGTQLTLILPYSLNSGDILEIYY